MFTPAVRRGDPPTEELQRSIRSSKRLQLGTGQGNQPLIHAQTHRVDVLRTLVPDAAAALVTASSASFSCSQAGLAVICLDTTAFLADLSHDERRWLSLDNSNVAASIEDEPADEAAQLAAAAWEDAEMASVDWPAMLPQPVSAGFATPAGTIRHWELRRSLKPYDLTAGLAAGERTSAMAVLGPGDYLLGTSRGGVWRMRAAPGKCERLQLQDPQAQTPGGIRAYIPSFLSRGPAQAFSQVGAVVAMVVLEGPAPVPPPPARGGTGVPPKTAEVRKVLCLRTNSLQVWEIGGAAGQAAIVCQAALAENLGIGAGAETQPMDLQPLGNNRYALLSGQPSSDPSVGPEVALHLLRINPEGAQGTDPPALAHVERSLAVRCPAGSASRPWMVVDAGGTGQVYLVWYQLCPLQVVTVDLHTDQASATTFISIPQELLPGCIGSGPAPARKGGGVLLASTTGQILRLKCTAQAAVSGVGQAVPAGAEAVPVDHPISGAGHRERVKNLVDLLDRGFRAAEAGDVAAVQKEVAAIMKMVHRHSAVEKDLQEAVRLVGLKIMDDPPAAGYDWAQGDTDADAFAQLQMVGYTLDHKTRRHVQFIGFLEDTGEIWGHLITARAALAEQGERLAAARALCSMQLACCQFRGAAGTPLLGEMKALVKTRDDSAANMQQSGLSALDLYYAEVSKLLEAVAVAQRRMSAAQEKPTAQVTNGLSKLLAGVLEAALSHRRDYASLYRSGLRALPWTSSTAVREVLLEQLRQYPEAPQQGDQGASASESGKQVVRLGALLLDGYKHQGEAGRAWLLEVRQRHDEWCDSYQGAKQVTFDRLVSLGRRDAAWEMSHRHYYFHGIMTLCTKAEDASSGSPMGLKRLRATYNELSEVMDHSWPHRRFLDFALYWLQERNRRADFLEMGGWSPERMFALWNDLPDLELMWMQQVKEKRFLEAAETLHGMGDQPTCRALELLCQRAAGGGDWSQEEGEVPDTNVGE